MIMLNLNINVWYFYKRFFDGLSDLKNSKMKEKSRMDVKGN